MVKFTFFIAQHTIIMDNEVHIGNLIAEVLAEEGRAASWLAKKLHYDKSNIYRILKSPTINTLLLLKISRLLEHDFFRHYSMLIQENHGKTEHS